jgi:gamma-glutamyltranspeptidase/glutathione hydrolase
MTKRIISFSIVVCLFILSQSASYAKTPPAAGIATAHPLATEAGFEILHAGGNAFDAAIAITATLAVVEPMSSGLGGGGFWLLHRARDGFETMIDGREKAPKRANRDMYLDKDGNVIPGRSINGPLAAGIPGVPAALVHLAAKYGRLPLARSLAPAIKHAQLGFVVDDHYVRTAKFRLDVLKNSPEAEKIFLTNSEVPQSDDIIKQADLARVLKAIARQGNKGFYQGPVAKKLVEGVQQAGGIWTLEDLLDYRIVEREPIHGSYRGMRITSASPPSSGGVALVTMLNILSGYELQKMDTVTKKHLIIEAMRRAYRDRAQYLGDPDFVKMPIKRLLHPYYAAGLRAAINIDKATPSSLLPGFIEESKGTDTTHFSVMDTQGNRVAATLSINFPFGSGFVPPGTGILLNDEMDDFSAKPGAPNVYGLVGAEANAIAAEKRPLSSMTPTFLENQRGIAVLGTPGGSRIITMVLLATLDYAAGGNPTSMVSLPRYHHQYLPDVVQYEQDAFSDQELTALQAMGHSFKLIARRFGNMQVVVWDRQAHKVFAASDPRGRGDSMVQEVTEKTE